MEISLDQYLAALSHNEHRQMFVASYFGSFVIETLAIDHGAYHKYYMVQFDMKYRWLIDEAVEHRQNEDIMAVYIFDTAVECIAFSNSHTNHLIAREFLRGG